MHTGGSREFAAYAQTLRRMHMAKLLERSAEAMRTSHRSLDVYDILFGDVTLPPQAVADAASASGRSR
jgi:hypothetical protein